ncbi:hypothetical protein D9613_004954 [Agrocybe pediades]|uniref:C2H2-type domain-containing protein n=1 Tax=Agrocybe pediades TaxID=84607 RepID=A0A8H4QXU3_9AGAR|nr:hypothetical protein D9613_004954 [Agrocybe pediades]
MSVQRFDPNAAGGKYISPEQYEQNLISIAEAKAKLEAFERLNDEGRRRFEQLRQEELELERKVQEGQQAKLRLQQMREQNSSIALPTSRVEDGHSARIEEVASSPQVGSASFQGDQTQSRRQSFPSVSSSSSSHQSRQGFVQNPPSNHNYQQVSSMPPTQHPPARRVNIPNFSHSTYNLPSVVPYYQNPSNVVLYPTNHHLMAHPQQGYSQTTSFRHYVPPAPSHSESSLAGALGDPQQDRPSLYYKTNSGNVQNLARGSQNASTQNAANPHDIEPFRRMSMTIPPVPAPQFIAEFQRMLNRWSAIAPVGSHFPGTIVFHGVKIDCFKHGNSIFVKIPSPTGADIYAPFEKFLDQLLGKGTTPLFTSSTIRQASVQNGPQSGQSPHSTMPNGQNRPHEMPSTAQQVNLRQPQSQSAPQPVPALSTTSQAAPVTPIATASPSNNVDPISMRTPKQADLKHLAHDILFNLGKRQRATSSSSHEQPAKRHAPESVQPQVLSSHIPTATNAPAQPSTTSNGPTSSSQTQSSALVKNQQSKDNKVPVRPEPPSQVQPPAVVPAMASTSAPSSATLVNTSLVPEIATIETVESPAKDKVNVSSALSTTAPPAAHEVIDLTSARATPSRPFENSTAVASSSKLPKKAKEPLFLPSSPSPQQHDLSPSPKSLDTSSASRGNVTPANKVRDKQVVYRRKENLAYVLVPPPPEYLVRYREQIEKGKGKWTLPPAEEGADRNFTKVYILDEEEREAIQLSSSRVQQITCRWDGCDHQLNSADSLIRHLEQIHVPKLSSSTSTFMYCDDSFRSGSQLLKHFKTKHANGVLKPSAKPFKPVLAPLDDFSDVPRKVPTYIFVTRPIGRKVLSRERHPFVAKWVATNIIYSDRDMSPKKRSRKVVRGTNGAGMNAGGPVNNYEYVKVKSTRPSTQSSREADGFMVEDLDSANISRMFAAGLTLWGSGDEESDGDHALGSPDSSSSSPLPQSPSFTPQRSLESPVADIKEEEVTEVVVSYGSVRNHSDEQNGSDREDAAVESMLTA